MTHIQPSVMIYLSRFVCWRVETLTIPTYVAEFYFFIITQYAGVLIVGWFPKPVCA